MCQTPEPAADVQRLAARIKTLAQWVIEDVDAGDIECAEQNAVALIDAAAKARQALGAMTSGREQVARLIA